MTFREKSAWISMVAIVLVYGFFGFKVMHAPPTRAGVVVALIGSTILVILLHIIAYAAAVKSRKERPDERDALIALRGARFGYYALAAGLWCLIFLALAAPPPAILAYAALGAFILGAMARLASQLVMYRLS